MVSESIGIVDASAFCKTVQEVCRGNEVPIIPLMRTVAIEFWLRAMREHEVLSSRVPVVSFRAMRTEQTAEFAIRDFS